MARHRAPWLVLRAALTALVALVYCAPAQALARPLAPLRSASPMRAQLAPAERIALFRAPGASEHAFGGGASAVTRPSRPARKALGWGHATTATRPKRARWARTARGE
ncbi:MAG: hypothetical protein FWD17_12965 [Polyangiaceae bacterium]|nr:hypothetical protein [Polyangiaceae bacterium]